MADEIRTNRPVYQSPRPENAPMNEMPSRRRGGMVGWIILAIIVIALVVLGVLFRDKIFTNAAKTSGSYQAVFLTNGQVYFGKLSDTHGAYVTLTDIYYLQVTQPPLQGSQQQTAAQQAQPQLSLVKLGNELHGPVDKMQINRDQILFYEDMKADGKVSQAIEQYKRNPNPAPATESNSVQQATPPSAPLNK